MRTRLCFLAACLLVAAGARATDDITAQVVFRVANGYLDYTRSVNAQWTITNTAPNISGLTQSLPTNSAGTLVSMGSVVNPGWAWFRNLSTNHAITVGVQDANTNYLPFLKMKAGEYGLMRLGATTLYGRSEATNGASVILEKAIVDD